MESKTLSPRQLRERKFLFRAPVVAVPLLALIFSGMGGGKGEVEKVEPQKTGINTTIPEAHLQNDKNWNKESYYKRAQQDSLEKAEKVKSQQEYAARIGIGGDSAEHAVQKVEGKMVELKKVLSQGAPVTESRPSRVYGSALPHGNTMAPGDPKGADIEKLERIMGIIHHKDAEADPQIAQLSSVLDKVIAAEHPERARDSVASKAKDALEREALSVRVADAGKLDSAAANAPPEIEALVPDEQALTGGARIRLELAQDLVVGRQLIPRGCPVYGNTSLSGERLLVLIRSITWEQHVFPVSLQVYDQDGLAGIYIPGVPGTDGLRESAGQDINSLGIGAFSPTLAGQAAGAGIDAARSLIGKKVRRVRVVVPADYRVILKDGRKSNGL
jgi:hypothetical protein